MARTAAAGAPLHQPAFQRRSAGSAPLVIAISGLACILAGLGGRAAPSLRQLQRGEG